jgi:hypothetical protein
MGVDHGTARRWLLAGVVTGFKAPDLYGPRTVMIPNQEVEAARRLMGSLVSAERFLAENQIDAWTYRALRSLKLLRVLFLGHSRYLWRADVSTLICHLELVSSPSHAGPRNSAPLFNEATVRLALSLPLYDAFVRAALAGDFRIHRLLHRPGLSSFLVGQEGLRWLRKRVWAVRSPSDGAESFR